MTDIARPSNPSLSYSSLHDEVGSYRRKEDLTNLEVDGDSPSSRTTLAESVDSSASMREQKRSKSAPPQMLAATLKAHSETDYLSATFDVSWLHRSSSQTSSSSHSCSPLTWQPMHLPLEQNPDMEGQLRTPARTNPITLAASRRAQQHNPLSTSGSKEEDSSWVEREVLPQLQVQPQQKEAPLNQLVDGRQLTRPIPLQTAIPTSTAFGQLRQLQLPQQQEQRTGSSVWAPPLPPLSRPDPHKPVEVSTTISPTPLRVADQVSQALATTSLYPHHEEEVLEEIPRDNTNSIEKGRTTGTAIGSTEGKTESPKSWCEKAAQSTAKEAEAFERQQRRIREQQKHDYQVNFPTSNTDTTQFLLPIVPGRDVEQVIINQQSSHSNHHRNNEPIMRENQEQHHRDRMNSLRASSGGASLLHNEDNMQHQQQQQHHHHHDVSVQPTPLFERLVTEEVQELKTYAGIVERQNQELAKQKKVQEDLEARLRSETRRRKELEGMLEEQERLWNEKYVDLELQRDSAEKRFQGEEIKTKKLIDQVQRKDRDIQGFIKKKYDTDGGRSIRSGLRPGVSGQSERNMPASVPAAARSMEFPQQSPQQLLSNLGSDEKVREGNAKNLLLDFFGI